MRKRCWRWLSPCLITGAALLSPNARGDELSLQATLDSRLSFNDNVDLVASNRRADSAIVLNPQLRLLNRQEAFDLAGNVGVTATEYASLSDHNRVDANGSLSAAWSGEQDQWGATLQSVRDTTLNSEVPATGIIMVRRSRTSTNFAPQWQRALDPTTKLGVNAQYTQVSYQKGSGLIDYTNSLLSTSLEKALTERTVVTGTLGGSQYRAADDRTKSSSLSYTLALQHRLTERLNLSLQAGQQQVTTTQRQNMPVCSIDATSLQCFLLYGTPYDSVVIVPVRTHQSVTSYGLSANQSFETGSLALSLSRSVNPTGTGSLVRTDGVSLNYRQEIFENFSFSGFASLIESRYLDNMGSGSRMTQFGTTLSWKLERNLDLGFSLQKTAQRPLAGGLPIEATQGSINLIYVFDPVARSH